MAHPIPRVTHCPRRHELARTVCAEKSLFFTVCKGPHGSTLTYHKWGGAEPGTPFFSCPCAYTVCVACAEVGEYEAAGAAGEGVVAAVVKKIAADAAKSAVQEALKAHFSVAAAAAGGVSPFGALGAAWAVGTLAKFGAQNIALWRACCAWRETHARLAAMDDAALRALGVAAAAGNDTQKMLAVLARGALEEDAAGRLHAPPPAAFAANLARTAAALHAANDAGRTAAFASLASSAASAAACSVA